MKKSLKSANHSLTLGDMIIAVSSQTRNNRETLAAVTDLLESGRVRFNSAGKKVRAHVF